MKQLVLTPENPLEVYWCEHTKKCGWRGLDSSLREKPDEFGHTLVCPNCGTDAFYIRAGNQSQIDAWKKPRTVKELESLNTALLAALKDAGDLLVKFCDSVPPPTAKVFKATPQQSLVADALGVIHQIASLTAPAEPAERKGGAE